MNQNRLAQNLARDNRALKREILKLNYFKYETIKFQNKTVLSKLRNSKKSQNKNGASNKTISYKRLFNILLIIFMNITCFHKAVLEFNIKICMLLCEVLQYNIISVIQKLINRIKTYMKRKFTKDLDEEYNELIRRKVMSDVRFRFRDCKENQLN
jgi:hypothetical protein